MKTMLVPIVKHKTGDICDRTHYRPISLATIVAKVLDSLLGTQLDKYISLHNNQFGFRPGLSTESAILCLKQTVKYYSVGRTPTYACFLDLSKTFDLVNYDILWQKLKDTCMPEAFTRIFKFWYKNQINVVRWSETYSKPYRLECGVRQGGLTSPKLFNLYINALIEELSSARLGCHIDGICFNNISYADDMALLSASVCGLTKLLGICENYASSHGLYYNVKKSECMVFEAKGKHCLPVYL
ncbi:jg26058 [Pararge aegeria aegeria]|uniref:Jg26058 protein n=1 Tax=Pararge aegeria aegeria TaxID=348720 RepID=A0A8S4R033_9NEOP|nr:jg26058 [Pararge aegeria aegeria]